MTYEELERAKEEIGIAMSNCSNSLISLSLYKYSLNLSNTLKLERDLRFGVESYGYFGVIGTLSTLEYISDRWQNLFRLRWLIDLANPNYTITKEELL